MSVSVRRRRNPYATVGGVKFTVGVEASNVIRVTAKLQAPNRADAAPVSRQVVTAYLTQSTSTLAVAGSAPDGTVVIGASKGSIVVSPTAKLVHLIAADANGEIALDITHVAGAATWYLVVVVDGTAFVSGAITFA